MSKEFWLEIEADGEARRVRLSVPQLGIGRASDNEVVVRDRCSSRYHCRLIVTSHGVLLEDLGSRNGTVHRGTTVTKVLLASGDGFYIGKTRFTVVESASSAGGPERSAGAAPTAGAAVSALPVASAPDRPSRESAIEMTTSSAATASGAGVLLEWLDGERRGERVAVAFLPFGIGRRAANALTLEDQRASGQHARIVEAPGGYYLEDLGSRNGTYLDRRRVTRARLRSGAVLQIGSTRFRVELPESAALPDAEKRGRDPGGSVWCGADDLSRFDVDAFREAHRFEHPVAVVAIVLILGVICYFSVDLARRLMIQPVPDPPLADNAIGDEWSFEGAGTEAAGVAAPGWRLADGDRGVLRVDREFARYPGRRALHITAAGAAGELTRARLERILSVRAGARYRCGGFVRNRSAFAAGFMVEWLRDVAGKPLVVARSFSATARKPNEALVVERIVAAPAAVARARLSCFVLGGAGEAVFDRVLFAPLGVERDPGGQVVSAGRREATERTYTFGPSRQPLRLSLLPDGTMSLSRGRRVLLSELWIGLSPERDPGRYGTRLAALRVLAEEDTGLSFVAEIPDSETAEWVTVEGSVAAAANEAHVRLRRSSRTGAREAGPLCLYFEPQDHAAALRFPESGAEVSAAQGELPATPQTEIVLGERSAQVVVAFSPAVRCSALEHHDSGERRLLLAASEGPEELALVISTTSRLEKDAAVGLVKEADELYRSGRVGAAVALLERVARLFPEQAAAIAIAEERAESWRRESANALGDLHLDVAALRAAPGPVLYELIRSRAAEIGERFRGLASAARAAKLAREAQDLWSADRAQHTQAEVEALFEKGRAAFRAEQLGLARLFLRQVVERLPESDWARMAEITLQSIDERRAQERRDILR